MAELEHGYVVMEYQPNDVHRTNGQHVFGDVRAAIGAQLKKQLEARYAASKTQGAVAAMNPTAFRETRDVAWQLGRKHNLLPSMHLALVTQNMSTHHTFIGAEIGPCTWCKAEQGASAAHFLQCPALAEDRAPFEEQIYQTFVAGAAVELGKLESQPTRQQVLQNILHVQAVDDQAADEHHVPAPVQIPVQPAAPKKSRTTCPRCQGDYALTKSGKPTAHVKKCNERVAAAEAAIAAANAAAIAAAEAAAAVAAAPNQPSAADGTAPEAARVAPAEPAQPKERYGRLQHRKNASVVATYTGIFSVFTLAFFAAFIPQELSRKSVVRKIRELLLLAAHHTWWSQREKIAADSAKALMHRNQVRRGKLRTSAAAHQQQQKRRANVNPDDAQNPPQNHGPNRPKKPKPPLPPPQSPPPPPPSPSPAEETAANANKHWLQSGERKGRSKKIKPPPPPPQSPPPPPPSQSPHPAADTASATTHWLQPGKRKGRAKRKPEPSSPPPPPQSPPPPPPSPSPPQSQSPLPAAADTASATTHWLQPGERNWRSKRPRTRLALNNTSPPPPPEPPDGSSEPPPDEEEDPDA